MSKKTKVCVIGAGFTGLTAAYQLSKHPQYQISIYDKDKQLGGLAASFKVGGNQLDKFYHHWFSNDQYALQLVEELGLSQFLIKKNSNTGMYYANRHYRLSTPLDLLKFSALSLIDRVRLGVFTLYVRRIRNWTTLESLTAYEWLHKICGEKIFNVVWKPLLDGKFGSFADKVSAVWMWNKLKLRGSSRDNSGSEHLCYLRGGFQRITKALKDQIINTGGEVYTGCNVTKVVPFKKKWHVDIDKYL